MKKDRHLTKISSLFDTYKKRLIAPQGSVKKEVCEVIKDVCGFDITVTQVEYTVSTRVVALRVPSVLKQEIMFHKEELLAHLKGRLGVKNAPTTIL